MTAIIFTITLSYASGKMIELVQRKDPFITESIETNFYDAENGLNLNQANF